MEQSKKEVTYGVVAIPISIGGILATAALGVDGPLTILLLFIFFAIFLFGTLYFIGASIKYFSGRIERNRAIKLFFPLYAELARVSATSNSQIKWFVKRYYGESYYEKNMDFLSSCIRSRTVVSNWKKIESFMSIANGTMKMHALYEVIAFATLDRNYCEKEDKIVMKFARVLKLSNKAIAQVKAMFSIRSEEQKQEDRQKKSEEHHNYYYSTSNPTDKKEVYQQILGVDKGATMSDIKKKYYKLAKLYHPDKVRNKSKKTVSEATEMFHKISEAYEILSEIGL